MSTFDSSTVCIFGENSKNRSKCALITFNAKCEEKVVVEIDYRLGCLVISINFWPLNAVTGLFRILNRLPEDTIPNYTLT